ncbi:hypothetical protein [Ligilactobacillus salivarius]|nr:hypothetical protein [Ligilactobacillus salivarius]MBE7387877.1 hypothetical protein [Ligilactobacillus salivarius]
MNDKEREKLIMEFEKELKEIVERYVDVVKKQSKAKNIDEFIKDESTIYHLNRIYDTKSLLTDLSGSFGEETELDTRIKQYGLGTVFAVVNSVKNYYVENYNSGEDEWLNYIVTDLNHDFPIEYAK